MIPPTPAICWNIAMKEEEEEKSSDICYRNENNIKRNPKQEQNNINNKKKKEKLGAKWGSLNQRRDSCRWLLPPATRFNNRSFEFRHLTFPELPLPPRFIMIRWVGRKVDHNLELITGNIFKEIKKEGGKERKKERKRLVPSAGAQIPILQFYISFVFFSLAVTTWSGDFWIISLLLCGLKLKSEAVWANLLATFDTLDWLLLKEMNFGSALKETIHAGDDATRASLGPPTKPSH